MEIGLLFLCLFRGSVVGIFLSDFSEEWVLRQDSLPVIVIVAVCCHGGEMGCSSSFFGFWEDEVSEC